MGSHLTIGSVVLGGTRTAEEKIRDSLEDKIAQARLMESRLKWERFDKALALLRRAKDVILAGGDPAMDQLAKDIDDLLTWP